MVDVHTFFSEVSNVQDKALNLLVSYFICVCQPKQNRILKAKVLAILLFQKFIFRFRASQ